MVQLLILYYLSLKSTHGYEIQKFIQLSEMDKWNNIQSGSIYYAMSKLEKNEYIKLIDTLGTGEKSKRIFAITEKGRSHLKEMAMSEMQKSLWSICSEKFLVYPMVANLTKEELSFTISTHIEDLKRKEHDIEKWTKEKENTASSVERATLQLMKNTVCSQIAWHDVLLENIDETIKSAANISQLIKSLDFSKSAIEVQLQMP
ncbi:PadR family transcriptional regulator [Sinanaerobacter sp. ZZT-01]|uniref:PadR family transcriptional regulator n=1 Tax=Sinanaerobacter sp. ZZT-01 TaxID=3111540 RepID=UPI002D7869E2|nr:PadR family transcriptional regulator [Sinanaerobacter sp. ZZT-01]WRR92338.1 PadR family transcriptional regulator [Sinanaerobacter sp. ZZT-01]